MQMTMNESKVKVGKIYHMETHMLQKLPPDSLHFLQKHKNLIQRSILKRKKNLVTEILCSVKHEKQQEAAGSAQKPAAQEN